MPIEAESSRTARGFTLIELLVVVAIIALLISILLPALSLARAQAKQLLCLTNLHSLGQAAMLYANENEGTVIRAELDVGTHDNIHYAVSLLRGLGYDGKISGLFRQHW